MTVVQADAEVATTGPAPGRRRRRVPRLLLNGISVVLGIALWWVLAKSGFDFPTPPAVVKRGGELLADGTLEGDIAASLARVLAGFLLGVVLAVPVGFLMGWYQVARGLLEPWVQFFRTIPPLAIIPLAIVLMGIGVARTASSRDGVTWDWGGAWTLSRPAALKIGLVSMGGTGATARFDFVHTYRQG